MEYPSAERLPDTEQEQLEFYEKGKGSAGIHGQEFEYKFCALVFLWATNKGYKFKFASNAKGFGAFDDVVVEYLDDTSRKLHTFLQLKSKKEAKPITTKELRAEKGSFSLRKYYKSYIQIEEKFKSSKEGVKIDGSIEDSLFIIYTNADVEKELKCNKATEIGEEEFLMTGGSVLQFDKEEHKAIYEHLQELPKHREFLSRFRIFYCQAGEKAMDCHIKRELQQSMMLPDSALEFAYKSFRDFMKDWWQNSKFFLKETNCNEIDPLRKTSEIVRTTLLAKILEQREFELDKLNIKYKESAITAMKQLIQPHKSVLIYAPGRSTTLTAAKIRQMLSATEHMILKSQQLVRYKSEVMFAWKNSLNVLVLEGDSTDENFQDVFKEIYKILNEHGAEKKFIFISSIMGSIGQRSALDLAFSKSLEQEYDDWKFTEVVTESQRFFLEKKVSFQGAKVKLSDILNASHIGIFNALEYDTITLLLDDEKLSIGIPIEDTVEYYIDRTLQCRNDVKISSYREENFESEATTVWKPSTILEGENRVILVTDEPGMGKSTLLTHLAKETRERQLETWMVRVNLNNYTKTLDEIKKNPSDENGATKLLEKAAKIKATDGLRLEGQLFLHTYCITGNMAVLIDGVDEVIPHYIEEVTQILKILSRTEIKKIWVTSRYAMNSLLEQDFQCPSYSLMPFDEKEQKCFLVKFWKKECLDVPCGLGNLANRVVELSMKHLSAGDKHFMGLPLQSMVLAEMFLENVKQCSTSITAELPECINLVMLYDFYVKKKWNIYSTEKKLSDHTNVNVNTDDDTLYDIFIDNHKTAALMAILSTNQLDKLKEKNVLKKGADFLQKIEKLLEKTGIITDVIEERPVFQLRTLAEYFVARWLCDNIQASQTFMRDHIFEPQFHVVRSMVDRILADKCPLHEAVLNSNLLHVTKLLRNNESLCDKDKGGRTPLHVAVSGRSPELIRLLLDNGADVSSVDTFLSLSPVDYANRMDDWEMLSLMMEKRPDIRELVLNRANHDCVETIAFALRAATKYGHNDLLKYLKNKENCGNMVHPRDNSTLLHEAARNQQTETLKILVQLGASTDCTEQVLSVLSKY